MAGLESLIPGLQAAEDRYRETQMDAFLRVGPLIGGMVFLKPFTPQMYIELNAAGNKCLGGETPGHTDIFQLLWRCSEKFDATAIERRREFWQACSILEYETISKEIDAYLRDAFSGQPHWGGDGAKSAGVWPAAIVHMIAHAYGWTDTKILNTPFRILWQYLHRIMEENNPKYRHRCMESLKLRAEYLVARNEQLNRHGRN